MNSKTHMIWQPLHRPFYALRRKRNFVDDDFDPTGFLLKEPVTKKIGCENIIANGLEIGHASMQGYRQTMEDEHVIEVLDSLPDHTLVAVMDGNFLAHLVLPSFIVAVNVQTFLPQQKSNI